MLKVVYSKTINLNRFSVGRYLITLCSICN